MLPLNIAMFLGAIGLFVSAAVERVPLLAVLGVLLLGLSILTTTGFFTLQPNTAAVLILFGSYQGTVKTSGFFWTNPFNKREKISLRSRNFNSGTQKVNEKRGNPIEIAECDDNEEYR